MTQPARVIGFLDVAGAWDATLLYVMGGAVVFGNLAFPRVIARRRPVLSAAFALPVRSSIDAGLVIGAGLFGIGWGLSGYCPGPAMVSLAAGSSSVMAFVACMTLGIFLGRRVLDRF